MTPAQRTLLKQYALATLGVGAVAVSLFFGSYDPATGVPDPIEVNGETINFTWTDDNTDEDLIIYTDKKTYEDGLSSAAVYAAVTNMSDVAQNVSLQGYFVNQRRHIKDVSVLTEVTRQATSSESQCNQYTKKQIDAAIAKGTVDPSQYTVTIAAGQGSTTITNSTIYDVCKDILTETYATSTEWVPLPQKPRDLFEVAQEQDYLSLKNVSRKQVEGFIAEYKTIDFPIQPGKTMYYKLDVEYPVNDSGNFYLEAIGDQGGYGHLDPWFDASWGYRVAITVDDAKVPSTQTSFPVYVNLADLPSGFFTHAKSDGCDIRVVESDETTETAFELVSYSAGGTGELHFKADSLTGSGGGDTTFYIYYGNSGASCYAATDTYGRNAVWSDYKLVMHMNEDPSGTIIDSTGHYSTVMFGSMTSGDLVTAKLGKGLEFDGVNDFLEIGSTGAFDFTSTDNVIWSAWADYDTNNTSNGSLFGYEGTAGENRFIRHKYANTGNIQYEIRNNSVQTESSDSNTDPTIGFNHVVFWRSVSSLNDPALFVNGASNYTVAYDIKSTALSGLSNEFTVGAAVVRSNVPASSAFLFGGIIDEVRVLYNKGDANWLTTEYNNQSSPATFYTVGAEESNGGGTARRIIMIE